MNEDRIIQWAQRLLGVAQCGLTYNHDNPYETERYHQIQALAAEMMAAVSEVSPEALLTLFTDESRNGYATPKVDVRGVVFTDRRILLVKEHLTQRWTLPGGWVDVGDTPSVAVEREVFEESGYEVQARKLLIIADRNRHYPPSTFHIYKLFFLCELLGGSSVISHETDEIGFFAEDSLPPLDEGRTSAYHLAHCFEHYRDSNLPTEFD